MRNGWILSGPWLGFKQVRTLNLYRWGREIATCCLDSIMISMSIHSLMRYDSWQDPSVSQLHITDAFEGGENQLSILLYFDLALIMAARRNRCHILIESKQRASTCREMPQVCSQTKSSR